MWVPRLRPAKPRLPQTPSPCASCAQSSAVSRRRPGRRLIWVMTLEGGTLLQVLGKRNETFLLENHFRTESRVNKTAPQTHLTTPLMVKAGLPLRAPTFQVRPELVRRLSH